MDVDKWLESDPKFLTPREHGDPRRGHDWGRLKRTLTTTLIIVALIAVLTLIVQLGDDGSSSSSRYEEDIPFRQYSGQ